MSYNRQNFKDKTFLYADELNHIEDGIIDLENRLADIEGFIGYNEPDIFGVEIDFANNKFSRLAGATNLTAGADFDTIKCFGERKRCNLTNDGRVLAYYGDENFSINGYSLEEANTPVQVMVEQPQFYYKVVPLVLEKDNYNMKIIKARYYVSNVPKVGFKLHPAFIENGKENQKVYFSAFEGSLFDISAESDNYIANDEQIADFNNDLLSSIANVQPISGKEQALSIVNSRKLAKNRGNGWELSYAATISATQLLMLIEYASFNMQVAIGTGVTNSKAPAMTGGTVTLGNNSGAINNNNNLNIISYRGEENFYGNMSCWVDGMNFENPKQFEQYDVGDVYVADHGFASNSSQSPYVNTKIYPKHGAGYISAFGYSQEFDWLFIAVEQNGNNIIPVGDYFGTQTAGWRVPSWGGRYDWGDQNGAFCLSINNQQGYYGSTYGARLVYIPSKATI